MIDVVIKSEFFFLCWCRLLWNVKRIDFTLSSWKTMFYHIMFRKCKINELLYIFWRHSADLSQKIHECQRFKTSLMRQFVRFAHDKILSMMNKTQNWHKRWIYFQTIILQNLNSLIDLNILKIKKDMTTTFKRLWYKKLIQTRIQYWIKRMSRYVQKIIQLRKKMSTERKQQR